MKKDPLIEEIRAVRHIISDEHGHNTKDIISHYKALEKGYKDRIMTKSLSPSEDEEDAGRTE